MITNLNPSSFLQLLRTVFRLRASERGLTLLIDLPTPEHPDTTDWRDRREIATEWAEYATDAIWSLPFTDVFLASYPNVGSNNGDLPDSVSFVSTMSKTGRTQGKTTSLRKLLSSSSVVLSITEMSATAPLKVLAPQFGFRGATLPGFTRAMIPALGLDYNRIHERVVRLKERMDRATGATAVLRTSDREYHLFLDLRSNPGHASGGIMAEDGVVGNLPSGEAYIVPFEGDPAGEESKTGGLLPVQFRDEIVVFEVNKNRAVRVVTEGPESLRQQELLAREPAYGNIAELGIGVLSEWGVQATGDTLLDEKLGMHIAFGRSDHFGGKTSPRSFSDPRNVIHIDWVYVPSSQPLITAASLVFHYPEGSPEPIVSAGKILV